MDFPANLQYTSDHEWIRFDEDGTATIGITAYATDQLGDVVYVDIETVGETVEKEAVFGSVEAVKTVADLFMPLDGHIIEANPALEDDPELVNKDPYGEGWMIKIRVEEGASREGLMDVDAYRGQIGKA